MLMTQMSSPIGVIRVVEEDQTITHIFFENENETCFSDIEESGSELLNKAKTQLNEYFHGKRKEFDLPLNPKGGEFFRRVWEELRLVPYGHTATYGDIAKKIGNPKAYRAVGLANNKNPIPIIIPCHRIIGANGKLVGFRGGMDTKSFLLRLESQQTHFTEN